MQVITLKRVASKCFFCCMSLIFLMLSGCLVGSNYKKAIFSVPADWGQHSAQISKDSVATVRWWRRLNDPVLDELINYAIAGNNNVAVAEERVREARASFGQTLGTLAPSISGSISENRISGSSDISVSQYRSGFDASWEIDLFGGRRRAVEAAGYGVDGAMEDLRATMVTLLGEVAKSYVEVRGWQQKLSIVLQISASHRQTFELIRKKLAAGEVSELDFSNAQAQMVNTEADISQIEASLAMSIHRLSVLTGRMPMALEPLLQKNAQEAKIPQPEWPIPAGIPANILLTRPDLRRAESQYAQAVARVGQREAERYPSFSLTGNISTTATDFDRLWEKSTIGWSFGPSIRLPLFDGGQLAASVEVARAQRDQAFITYRAAVLEALEDVENALVRLSKERQRLEKLTVAHEAYLRSLKISQSLFENGNTSFLELLNANRSYYSSQMVLADSRVALATQYIALMKALGGGWDGIVDVSRLEIVNGVTHSHTKVQ